MSEPNNQSPPEKRGFFARLKEKLSRTKESIVGRIKKIIRLTGKVDDALLEQIEEILLQGDVGVETTTKIIEQLRQREDARKAENADQVTAVLKDILRSIVEHDERQLKLGDARPYVILVVGVNGTGKTTTIAKLARRFRDQGLTTLLVAGDTFRAAAIEQLEIWAKRTGSDFISQGMGSDAGSVCYDALQAARARKIDVVLIDTAGRLHTKVNLMEELKKVVRVIRKVIPEAPHETLLVLDATTGQNAISQTKIFSEAVPVSGIVMTKLDGTAKGGILIAIRDLFDIPVVMIGVGESQEDLRDFDPAEFVDALFEE
ncbi:MAG: signal recognition particle-docking protein FtsY [Candidatus Sumerlaeia bacterium]|nr:signal recognition particle-docking protein FtsY [Candidatus Sumerlaeia bacterium]